MVREWDSQSWQLGERREFRLSKRMQLRQLANELSKAYPHIEQENMMCGRVITQLNFRKGDLLDFRWYFLHGSMQKLSDQPFYIGTDGYVLM